MNPSLLIIGLLLAIGIFLLPVYSVLQELQDRHRLSKLRTWRKAASARTDKPSASRTASVVDHLSKGRLSDEEWDDLFCALDEVTEAYTSSSKETREGIRDAMSSKRMAKVLLQYARLSALKLRQGFEEGAKLAIVKRGVAAVSIENFRTEWQESSIALGKLSGCSRKIGLDPGPAFEEVRRISSDRSPYPDIEDHPSMQSFLDDY